MDLLALLFQVQVFRLKVLKLLLDFTVLDLELVSSYVALFLKVLNLYHQIEFAFMLLGELENFLVQLVDVQLLPLNFNPILVVFTFHLVIKSLKPVSSGFRIVDLRNRSLMDLNLIFECENLIHLALDLLCQLDLIKLCLC
jgi:hypothetical protein